MSFFTDFIADQNIYNEVNNNNTLIQTEIDNINNLLQSNDMSLNTLQEIVDYIKSIQSELDNKVNKSQVLTDVPAGAVFTDTVYTLPASVVHETEYASSTKGGTVKMRIDGNTLYLTNNGDNA